MPIVNKSIKNGTIKAEKLEAGTLSSTQIAAGGIAAASLANDAKYFDVSVVIPSTAAATAANYGPFFIATRACTIVSISEVHNVAGNDAGAVTLSVERLQGTEAPGAGDDLLGTTKIDLKGTAATVQSPALTGTTASLTLAAGNRLCLLDTGTLTTLDHVVVTVKMMYV